MRVSVPDDVVFRDLGGEAVLLHLRSGEYFGLDEVGTLIWTLLADGRSVAEVEDQILNEYSATQDVVRGDLRALLEELCRRELLELREDA